MDQTNEDSDKKVVNELMKEAFNKIVEINKIRKIQRSEIKIHISQEIGSGGQGSVFFGLFEGEKVAVKKLSNVDWKNLCHELAILASLKHDHVPKLLGVIVDQERIETVIEFIEGNNLDSIVSSLKESEKLKIAQEISETIYYLHKCGYIHRDLKPANILITRNLKPYVIDFGISKVCLSNSIVTRAKGSIEYLSPESLDEIFTDEEENLVSSITNKVDVWAFGCMLSYLFSNIHPWSQKSKSLQFIQESLVKKEEFPIPKEIANEKIIEIIKECTIIDPEKRADMKTVRNKLRDI